MRIDLAGEGMGRNGKEWDLNGGREEECERE
jgi:hypothetical protein